MRRTRSARLMLLALSIALFGSCSKTTGPGGPGVARRVDLACTWPPGQAPDEGTLTVGPDGGDLELAHSKLSVPRGALATTTTFTMRELRGDSVGVQLTPSATFSKEVSVTIDVGSARCGGKKVDRDEWEVWRIPEGGGPEEELKTKRPFLRKKMVGKLTQNSWLIVAD